eukprot:COSAG02_NODE_1527_length_12090_cov_4.316070_2_plen_151_part_00
MLHIERVVRGRRYLNKAYYARIERGVHNHESWGLHLRVPSAFVVSGTTRAHTTQSAVCEGLILERSGSTTLSSRPSAFAGGCTVVVGRGGASRQQLMLSWRGLAAQRLRHRCSVAVEQWFSCTHLHCTRCCAVGPLGGPRPVHVGTGVGV